jgi:hypothetical protein
LFRYPISIFFYFCNVSLHVITYFGVCWIVRVWRCRVCLVWSSTVQLCYGCAALGKEMVKTGCGGGIEVMFCYLVVVIYCFRYWMFIVHVYAIQLYFFSRLFALHIIFFNCFS